jgi:putative transposase
MAGRGVAHGKYRPFAGKPRQLEIVPDRGQRFIVVVCLIKDRPPIEPDRVTAAGLDVGVKRLGAASDGEFEMPAGLAKSDADAARRRQVLERRSGRNKEGRLLPVQSRRRAKAAFGEAYGRLADKCADRLHKYSRKLAGSCVCLGEESTRVQKMTASARGTAEEPGKNVAQKTGLNRSIPSAGRAKLIAMLD